MAEESKETIIKGSNIIAKQGEKGKQGWGIEDLPYPTEVALIQTRWDLCTGCGTCEMACSMKHFGVINRELSRIRFYGYLLPSRSLDNAQKAL